MILDGKKIAKQIEINLKRKIKNLAQPPYLGIILVGRNPASLIYVNLKEKKAKKLGIKIKKIVLSSRTSQKRLIDIIEQLSKKADGIIVQLPLPKHLNAKKITDTIPPALDVDGFGEDSPFVSPAHQAILVLIKKSKAGLKNKKAAILAKTLIFAQPLKKLLEKQKIKTKIFLNPGKKNFSKFDIIISALGKPYFLKPEMIKAKSIIIDVGYSRKKGKAIGDVDPKCQEIAAFISPVPGGVGPLTVIYLLKNVYLAAKARLTKEERSFAA